MDKNPSVLVKELEGNVRRILRAVDILKQSRKDRETISDLRQVLSDARIYINAYELSETREEQLDSAKQAKHYLDRAGKDILTTSESDIFGTVDVAELTAVIEHIKSRLK